MKLSNLKSGVRVAFDYNYFDADGNEQSSSEWVDVLRLPFRDIAKLQKQYETVSEDVSALAQLIAPMIKAWSLTDDDGNEWGHDVESIMDLPFDFVAVVAETVVGKLTPGSTSKPTPANSDNG